MTNDKLQTKEQLEAQYTQVWQAYQRKTHRSRAVVRMEQVLSQQVELLGDNDASTIKTLKALAYMMRHLGEDGRIAHRKARFDKALQFGQRALAAAETVEPDNPKELALLNHDLTFAYSNKGDFRAAVFHQLETIRITESTENPWLTAHWLPRFYGHLGYWQAKAGNLEGAVVSLQTAVKLNGDCAEERNGYLMTDVYQWLGEAYKLFEKKRKQSRKS